MSKRQKQEPAELDPRGPEGVPIDAPDNDAPALSPQAVSRMHRAEDDSEALAQSPDFSDHRAIAHDEDRELKRWLPGTPENSQRDAASRGLDAANTTNGDVNPGHHPRKRDTDAPRGLGDGELMEQPASTAEAQQPGADTPDPD